MCTRTVLEKLSKHTHTCLQTYVHIQSHRQRGPSTGGVRGERRQFSTNSASSWRTGVVLHASIRAKRGPSSVVVHASIRAKRGTCYYTATMGVTSNTFIVRPMIPSRMTRGLMPDNLSRSHAPLRPPSALVCPLTMHSRSPACG
jgi:hypothetical protein